MVKILFLLLWVALIFVFLRFFYMAVKFRHRHRRDDEKHSSY